MDENGKNVVENSYKGVIIFLIFFAIIAIAATIFMSNLYLEKNKVDEQVQPSTSGENVEIELPEENVRTEVDQTYVLELDEFYTTNNLKTEEIDFTSGEVVIDSQYSYSKKYEENIQYIKIDGLKDEVLEKKINENLKNNAFDILNHEKAKQYAIAEVRTTVTANFSNILSVRINSYLYNKETYEDGSISQIEYLNYNLTNGEQIELEEIFAEGTSIKEILTEELYRDYSMGEDGVEWAYNVYIYENTGKYLWDYYYDYETLEAEIEKLGLMSQDEWIRWEYRSAIEEKVLKALLEIKNGDLEFLICGTYISLNSSNEEYSTSVSIRSIYDKVTLYKKFLTEESIFTDEYDLSREEMCGWPIYFSNERIYFPAENMLLFEYIDEDEYLNEELKELAKKKFDADVKYAQDTKKKFFIASVNVSSDWFNYLKFEINMEDYLENKDDILLAVSIYDDAPFVDVSVWKELGIDYLAYDYGYVNMEGEPRTWIWVYS